jgi:hypothetical protein
MDTVFLAIDIETCGIDKSIFSVACVLFKIIDKQMVVIDEKQFSFSPILPTTQIIDGDDGEEERIKYNDFTIDSWDNVWSKNIEIFEYISTNSTYKNEKELIDGFYLWWIQTTKKYHQLRIISDNIAMDIGYIDSRILKYRAEGSTKKPLNYQWRGKNWFYVLPIDTFSMEHIILNGSNGKQCLETIYQNCPIVENNLIENAKKIGWQYTQLMTYF